MTDAQSEGRATAGSILTALEDSTPTWITLPRSAADVPTELRNAVDDFNAGERPAARAATDWLKSQALDRYETARTRLLVAERRVAGFYSLASAQVELRGQHRRELGLAPDLVTVPAALVAWIARDASSATEGVELLLHAAATARRAAALQASALLVVDPFDDETAQMWRERFGFRASSQKGDPKRLWLPLNEPGV